MQLRWKSWSTTKSPQCFATMQNRDSVQEPDDRKSGCGCCAVVKVPLKHTEQGTLCVALDQ